MPLAKTKNFLKSLVSKKTPVKTTPPQMTLLFTPYLPEDLKRRWPDYQDPLAKMDGRNFTTNAFPSKDHSDQISITNPGKKLLWTLRREEFSEELKRQTVINQERGASGLTAPYGDQPVGSKEPIEQSNFNFSEEAKLMESLEYAIYSLAKKAVDVATSGKPIRGIEGISELQPDVDKKWSFHEVFGFADDLKRFAFWFGTIRAQHLCRVREKLQKTYDTCIDPSKTLTMVDIRQSLIVPSNKSPHSGFVIYVGFDLLRLSTPISYVGEVIYRELLKDIAELNLYDPVTHETLTSRRSCRMLAQTRPEDALQNLENWMWFIKDCLDPLKLQKKVGADIISRRYTSASRHS
ncbi:MAG: hypothetical protein KAH18_02180 [Psychromonas sp.]|nr:hypothetical protein [Psychromonas sp.]